MVVLVSMVEYLLMSMGDYYYFIHEPLAYSYYMSAFVTLRKKSIFPFLRFTTKLGLFIVLQ